nr:MAG TPA: hypothetical protein [Caudoviricetes sp.]
MCITLDGGSSPLVLPITFLFLIINYLFFLSRFVRIERVLLEQVFFIYI